MSKPAAELRPLIVISVCVEAEQPARLLQRVIDPVAGTVLGSSGVLKVTLIVSPASGLPAVAPPFVLVMLVTPRAGATTVVLMLATLPTWSVPVSVNT